MKRKIVVVILVVLVMCMLFPNVVLADSTLDLGGYYGDWTAYPGSGPTIFVGTANNTLTFTIGSYGTIVFDNAVFISDKFTIKYLDVNGILRFDGTSTLSSGLGEDGIGVVTPGNVALEIQGDGIAYITGRESGSGIGQFGSVNITNGTLYVSGDVANGKKDVECNVLTISGDAALFLEHGRDNSTIPTTTHTYYEFANASEVPAGYNVPSEWSYPIGAYLNLPNTAPFFTGDSTNTSQTVAPGDSIAPLKADDLNGTSDIAGYSLVGGSLPDGITLNNDGTFSGTVYAAGSYTATIEVRDAGSLTATTTLNITVSNEAPSFTSDEQNTTQTIDAGDSIAPLIAQDPNGISDIAGYSVVGGSLPDGITLNNDGTFTGTAGAGNYSMTFEVRDTSGLTDTTTLNLTVIDVLVDITSETTTLGFGETFTMTATTSPVGKTVHYYSTNNSIATVDVNTGLVTALAKEGRVVLLAQSASHTDECVLYVVDKSEPAPKTSDPVKTLSIQIKDDTGNPMVGVYVNLFSEPQTVRTDINGMAVFHNVPYNTNDPHTLIVQDELGSEVERYSLNFISGSAPSTSIDGNSINITFDNTVSNTNIAFTMVEDWIAGIAANVDYTPVAHQRVENPETGDKGFEFNYWSIVLILLLISLTTAVVKDLLTQNHKS